jgi:hypothetical protein
MATDRVTGTLTEENRQQILDLIERAKAQMPYLLDLSSEEQRTLLRLGDREPRRRRRFSSERW